MRINSKRKTGTPDGPHAEKKDLFDLNLAHVFFEQVVESVEHQWFSLLSDHPEHHAIG